MLHRSGLIKRTIANCAGLVAVLLILVALFSVASENFFQTSTLVSIANQILDLTFIAVGMTLVLIIGGIDLSVVSVLALSSAVLGVLMAKYGWPLSRSA
jgi:ribose transport system permease protein